MFRPLRCAAPGRIRTRDPLVRSAWFGLLVPTGTPKSAADTISAAIDKLPENPAILERLARLGSETQATANADFTGLLIQENDKVSQIVKLAGAKPE